MAFCKREIFYLENLPVPLINYFATFASIIVLRNFLEGFSHNYRTNLFFTKLQPGFAAGEFFHFVLFYIFIAFSLILTLSCLTREKASHVIKVLVPSFILILSVPCVDLLISMGKGHHISYLLPESKHSLFYYYLTFFGSATNISFGMRIEIFLALLGTFIYLQVKQKNIFVTLFGLGAIYTEIFFVIITPCIVKYFSALFHIDIPLTPHTAINYFLLFLFPLGASISFLANKKVFIAIIKDLRWLRLLHFELMLLLGVALAIKHFDIHFMFNFIFLSISILFFWLFSVITNNIADQNIDRISNPKRPLITGIIAPKQYTNIAYTVLCCSLLYALAVNTKSFFIICCSLFAYYIYSMPPLRFKRVPLFSKGTISVISLIIVLLGYINVRGNLEEFPNFFIWFFLLGFTLAANFIDIKDYAGDMANKITTLPVLFGNVLSKIFIGITFILTSIALYFYLRNLYLLPLSLISGILGFYFINQKKYQEWKIFCVYLSTITTLIFYILVNNLWH
jgi:4-hydroxybenzoate polyprenyltransferase